MIPAVGDQMAESTSQTTTSPLTDPSSFGSADPQGLPTVHEVPHYKTNHDFNSSMDHRLQSVRRPSGDSRNGSGGSSMGRSNKSFDDKLLEAPPQPYGYSVRASAAPRSQEGFEDDLATMTNGHGHQQEPPRASQQHNRLTKTHGSKKEKGRGFRYTIRRILGIQRNPKDRISMPTPAGVYSGHNPEEFITSATDVDTKPQRSASVPATGLPRRSALSSHPPLRNTTAPATATQSSRSSKMIVPPQPERRPPERPPRPRSASVPSILIKDMQAIEAALADPNALEKQESNVEAQNIGFAVTNGSNPKRRSRSVGAFPSLDHRMSPIQWHHIRRRSDEIRYWRESTQLTSLGGLKSVGSPDELSPNPAKIDDEETADDAATADGNADIGEHNQQFNFGLPADAMQIQDQERMGLEERLITLEIKLMDFEYALSKVQAGSASSQRNSNLDMAKRQESVDSYVSSPIEPSTQQELPKSVSHKPSVEDLMNPKPRPTSVATTIKRGAHHGTYTSSDKPPLDRSMRSSLTNLTIEHYTTLITLIRHEQSARQRLEEQITSLQGQIDRLAPPHMDHSHHASSSQHSHTYSQTSQQRRHGMLEPSPRRGHHPYMQRPRSSSYTTNETDTDDDAYHDVYTTPDLTPVDHRVERGEYERGAFDRIGVGEGVAF